MSCSCLLFVLRHSSFLLALCLAGCTCRSREPAIHTAARSGDLARIEALHKSGVSLDAVDSAGSTPLMAAIEGAGKEEDCMVVIQWLVLHGASVDSHDSLDRSALTMAAEREYTSVVTFLSEQKADINARGPRSGKTALLAGTVLDRTAAVETLLKRGADPNLGDADGRRPISEAVCNSTDCLRLLLAHGAKPNVADKYGLSPLHYVMMAPLAHVSEQERYEKARLLLQYGADPQKRCNDPLDIPDSVVEPS